MMWAATAYPLASSSNAKYLADSRTPVSPHAFAEYVHAVVVGQGHNPLTRLFLDELDQGLFCTLQQLQRASTNHGPLSLG
jgi:hypothetical protein